MRNIFIFIQFIRFTGFPCSAFMHKLESSFIIQVVLWQEVCKLGQGKMKRMERQKCQVETFNGCKTLWRRQCSLIVFPAGGGLLLDDALELTIAQWLFPIYPSLAAVSEWCWWWYLIFKSPPLKLDNRQTFYLLCRNRSQPRGTTGEDFPTISF